MGSGASYNGPTCMAKFMLSAITFDTIGIRYGFTVADCKKLAQEFCKETICHGTGHFASEPSIRLRLIWLMFVVTVLVAPVYLREQISALQRARSQASVKS